MAEPTIVVVAMVCGDQCHGLLCDPRSGITENISRSPSDVTEINFTPLKSLLNRRFRFIFFM